ncbi:MAG: dihydropteroate synthase [Alphaproteobacteria bacterium]|nr:dihydropteroate synthase [Alphaproteobacteria bacterium]
MCKIGEAIPLAGGPLAFSHGELISRLNATPARRSNHSVPDLNQWISEGTDTITGEVQAGLARLHEPREPLAGIALSGPEGKPRVMGIVNVTPDSFSDGGRYADADSAIAHGRALFAAGADIIDVGGESTRPGATPVTVDEERARVIPVIEALAGDGIVVSIDSRRAAVMAAAIGAGARIINDVSALTHDPAALEVVAASDAALILMHMQGTPETMQAAPAYDDVVLDVYDALADRVAVCEAAGIARSRICVDPGIGFGKTVAHNLSLIASLGLFQGLGCAVAIGVSRKSFIDAVAGTTRPQDRLAGSLAAMLAALGQGAQLVRVHDVAETVQAIALWRQTIAASDIEVNC